MIGRKNAYTPDLISELLQLSSEGTCKWGLTTKCVLLSQHHSVGQVEIGGELYESSFNIDMDGFGNPWANVSVIQV